MNASRVSSHSKSRKMHSYIRYYQDMYHMHYNSYLKRARNTIRTADTGATMY